MGSFDKVFKDTMMSDSDGDQVAMRDLAPPDYGFMQDLVAEAECAYGAPCQEDGAANTSNGAPEHESIIVL